MNKEHVNILPNCSSDDELFIVSFNYGIFPLIVYLYEFKRVKYNYSLLSNFTRGSMSTNNNYHSMYIYLYLNK